MIVCRDCKYLWGELKKLQKENRELEAALAEKPDVVFCKDCIIFKNCFIQKGYKLEFCSFGRKEAKDED